MEVLKPQEPAVLKQQQPGQQQQFLRGSLKGDPYARFTKGERIGCGAVKTVYKAFDEEEGMEVAWNEVYCTENCLRDKDTRQRMFAEINILQKLKHRNILRLLEWWHDGAKGVLVFITELLTDGSLRTYIRKHRHHPLGDHVIRRYAWQILQGLVYLHGHYPPIIHRDLKCDNILVNGTTGTIKIGDLGFATLQRGVGCLLSVIGTPEFMAPELYEETYDEKVDVYSFGMCLLEMATHEYPYAECTNPAQIYRRVTQGIPPAGLAHVRDPDLRAFITTCIAADPAKRPEARRLLTHPIFDGVRNCPHPSLKNLGSLSRISTSSSTGTVPTPGAAAAAVSTAAAMAAPPAAGSAPVVAPAVPAAVAVNTTASLAARSSPVGSPPVSPLSKLSSLEVDTGISTPADIARQIQTRKQQQQELSMSTGLNGRCALTALLSRSSGASSDSCVSSAWRGVADALVAANCYTAPSSPSQQLQQQQLQQQDGSRRASVDSTCSTDAPAIMGAAQQQERRHVSAPASVDDDMDERDVLFDQQTDQDVATEEDEAETSPHLQSHHGSRQSKQANDSSGRGSAYSNAKAVAAAGMLSKPEQQQGVLVLPAIREDAALDANDVLLCQGMLEPGAAVNGTAATAGREGVSCMCRRIASRQLSFDVGFVNLSGLTRRVGFQFDVGEDTAETIAAEMLENLSLRPEQADEIAVKIRDALESLGVHVSDSETEDADDGGFGNGSVLAASLSNGGTLHASLTNNGLLHAGSWPSAHGTHLRRSGSGDCNGLLVDGVDAVPGAKEGGSGDAVAVSAAEATVVLLRTLSQQLQHLASRAGSEAASPMQLPSPALPPPALLMQLCADELQRSPANEGAQQADAPGVAQPAEEQVTGQKLHMHYTTDHSRHEHVKP